MQESQLKSKDNNPHLKLCEVCGNKVSVNARVCPHCGEEYIDTKKLDSLEKEFAKAGSKSRIVSFILTVLFGPLGLIYTSFKNSIMMIFVWFIVANTGVQGNALLLIAGILYFGTILIGDKTIVKKRLLSEAKLMRKN